MSQANVEAIQNLFRAVEERDLETYLAAWDREVVIREPGSLPFGGAYLGPEGVRQHASAWLQTWSDLQPGVMRKLGAAYIDAGDHVVVRWRLRARAPANDTTLDMPMVSLYRLRDGKVVRAEMFYSDTAVVLRFLGDVR